MGERFRGKVVFDESRPTGGTESPYLPAQKVPAGFPDKEGNFTDVWGREFRGVKIITGNESPETREIVDQYAKDAKKEGVKKLPLLITYDSAPTTDGTGGMAATAGKLADGTTFVAWPDNLTHIAPGATNLSDDPATQKRQQRNTLAHESRHVWQMTHGKYKGNSYFPTDAENQKLELDANKAADTVTCDAESSVVFQQQRDRDYAAINNQTIDQYYATRSIHNAQPLPQTSLAQAEYRKAHPPKGCKPPKPGGL